MMASDARKMPLSGGRKKPGRGTPNTEININSTGNGGYRKKNSSRRFFSWTRKRNSDPTIGQGRSQRRFPWKRIGPLLPAQALGTSLLVILLLAILFEFATGNIRKFSPDDKDLLFLTLLLLGMLAVTQISLAIFPLVGQALPQIRPQRIFM
jgi:hypothetical protein